MFINSGFFNEGEGVNVMSRIFFGNGKSIHKLIFKAEAEYFYVPSNVSDRNL